MGRKIKEIILFIKEIIITIAKHNKPIIANLFLHLAKELKSQCTKSENPTFNIRSPINNAPDVHNKPINSASDIHALPPSIRLKLLH